LGYRLKGNILHGCLGRPIPLDLPYVNREKKTRKGKSSEKGRGKKEEDPSPGKEGPPFLSPQASVEITPKGQKAKEGELPGNERPKGESCINRFGRTKRGRVGGTGKKRPRP